MQSHYADFEHAITFYQFKMTKISRMDRTCTKRNSLRILVQLTSICCKKKECNV